MAAGGWRGLGGGCHSVRTTSGGELPGGFCLGTSLGLVLPEGPWGDRRKFARIWRARSFDLQGVCGGLTGSTGEVLLD
jgi:hypothetical protein